MKLTSLPILAASAGLLASANPMRVVVVSSEGGVVHMEHPPVHMMTPVPHVGAPGAAAPHAAPCGSRLRQKATSFSNAFRLALGFGTKAEPNELKHFKPIPDAAGIYTTKGGDRLRIMAMPAVPMQARPSVPSQAHGPHGHGHGHGRVRFHGARHSFLMRVHFALMSLGPWEGRAVAFVLGCGIGVLLRMVWVMAVVAFRMLKGPRSTPESEHEYTVVDGDAEEIFVAPPHYTYPIEKVELVEPVAEAK